jgi:hypothetical protein
VRRGRLGPEHVSGVKVVGDFVGTWRLGLPSELAGAGLGTVLRYR